MEREWRQRLARLAGDMTEECRQVEASLPGRHRLRVLRRLDHGGSAYVYLVRTRMRQEFVLKLLFIPLEPWRKARLEGIWRHLASLPGASCFALPLEVGHTEKNDFYYTLPRFTATLTDYLQTLEPWTRLELLLQLAQSLALLHDQGIVHRDVKPRNLLIRQVRGRHEMALSDFDFAFWPQFEAGRTQPPLEPADKPFGTPPYAPPEASPPWGPVTWGWDIWSFGMTAHEVLAGGFPFEASAKGGSSGPWREEYHQLCRGERMPCLRLQGHPMEQIIQRTLRLDAKERPTAAELIRALELALAASGRAETPGLGAHSLPSSQIQHDRRSPTRAGVLLKRLRSPVGMAAAAGAVLAVLMSVAGFVGSWQETRPEADPEAFFKRHYRLTADERIAERLNERLAGRVLAADLDGREGTEVATLVARNPGTGWLTRAVVLRADGQVRWERPLGRELRLSEGVYSANTTPDRAEVIRLPGGRPGLVVISNHDTWWPSRLLMLDGETGEILVDYLHGGHLQYLAAADVDGDGADEVYAGGTNNRLDRPKPGIGVATLAVLGTRRIVGRSPGVPEPQGLELPLGQELAYLRFPLSDVGLHRLQIMHSIRRLAIRRLDDGSMSIEPATGEANRIVPSNEIDATLIYSFDARTLVLQGLGSDNRFPALHAELKDEGKLQSQLDEAYFAKLMAGIRYWDGARWLTPDEWKLRLQTNNGQ